MVKDLESAFDFPVQEHGEYVTVFGMNPRQQDNRIAMQQNLQELTEFLEACNKLDSKDLVLEIGMLNGGTHAVWKRMFKTVWSLDVNEDSIKRVSARIKDKKSSKFFWGNSQVPITAEAVKKELNGRKLDMLFIDGDHSEMSIVTDWLLYRDFVREGGIIGFHDTETIQGPIKLMDALQTGNNQFTDKPIKLTRLKHEHGIAYYIVGEENSKVSKSVK